MRIAVAEADKAFEAAQNARRAADLAQAARNSADIAAAITQEGIATEQAALAETARLAAAEAAQSALEISEAEGTIATPEAAITAVAGATE